MEMLLCDKTSHMVSRSHTSNHYCSISDIEIESEIKVCRKEG